MEDHDLRPIAMTIHSEFGSIYREGEFVQSGSILGLAVDARRVVLAPVSGWVRVAPDPGGITVEIRPLPHRDAGA